MDLIWLWYLLLGIVAVLAGIYCLIIVYLFAKVQCDRFVLWRVRRLLRKPFNHAWDHARKRFATATCLYRSPISYGAIITPEFALLRGLIVKDKDAAVCVFNEELSSISPMLVAYCLVGLDMAKALDSERALAAIKDPMQEVRWFSGCISGRTPLINLLDP